MRKFLSLILGAGLMAMVAAPSLAMETTQPPPVTTPDRDPTIPKIEDRNGEADVTVKVGPNGDLLVSEVSDGGSSGSRSSGGGGGSDVSCIDLEQANAEIPGASDGKRFGVDDDFVDPVIDPNLATSGVLDDLSRYRQQGDTSEYVVPVSGRLYSPSGKW